MIERFCDRCGCQIKRQEGATYYMISSLKGPVISIDFEGIEICPKCYKKLKKFLKIRGEI